MAAPTRKELIEDIQKTAEEIDSDYLSFADYREHGQYSVYHIQHKDYFDSWSDAKEAAGLEVVERGSRGPEKYTDDELRQKLRELWSETEAIIQPHHINENLDVSDRVYSYRFGSLREATEAAGINDKGFMFRKWEEILEDKYGRYTNDELREFLPQFHRLFFKQFREWNEDRDKVEIRGPRPNSNQGQMQVFIRPEGKSYEEVMMNKYGDQIPEGYVDVFKDMMGRGFSPTGIVAALNYLTDEETTQKEAMNDAGCSPVTVRNVRNAIIENGYADRFDLLEEKFKHPEQIKELQQEA